MTTKVKAGTIWSNPLGTEFVVTAVARDGEETWIVYKERFGDKSFSCLESAFLSRFRQTIN